MKQRILFIGAADPEGTTGLQRDIELASELGLKSHFAITTLTANNHGNLDYYEIDPAFTLSQIHTSMRLSYPDIIKIGMLCSDDMISSLSSWIAGLQPKPLIVLDLQAEQNSPGLTANGRLSKVFLKQLLPLVNVTVARYEDARRLLKSSTMSNYNPAEIAGNLRRRFTSPILLAGNLNTVQQFVLSENDESPTIFTLSAPDCCKKADFSVVLAAHLAKSASLNEAGKSAWQFLEGNKEKVA